MNTNELNALIGRVGNALREARSTGSRSKMAAALRTVGESCAWVLTHVPHDEAIHILATIKHATGMSGDEFCLAMTAHRAAMNKKTRPMRPGRSSCAFVSIRG